MEWGAQVPDSTEERKDRGGGEDQGKPRRRFSAQGHLTDAIDSHGQEGTSHTFNGCQGNKKGEKKNARRFPAICTPARYGQQV